MATQHDTGKTGYTSSVGITEAARLVGKGKEQLYRDVRSGKLSAHVDTAGHRTFDVSELDRVYGLKPQPAASVQSPKPDTDTPAGRNVTDDRDLKIAVLEERAARLQAENDDLRRVRDTLLDTQKMLTAAPVSTSVKTWWERMWGK